MRIAIRQAELVDPFRGLRETRDLFIEDGKIVNELSAAPEREFSGIGKVLVPGFIDLHTHLRDPGQTYKEDIVSGTRAAAHGGFTTLCAMPNTTPVCDTPELVRYMREKAEREGFAEVLPAAAASLGEKGEELSDYAALKAAGAIAVTDDGRNIADPALLEKVLVQAAANGLPVMDHPEEQALSQGACMHRGSVSAALGLPGMPSAAESLAVARDILIAADLGLPVHLSHLSTAQSVILVREAKRHGVAVTCETDPHYIVLTDEAVRRRGPLAKMYPPLRTEEDRRAIIDGLFDGTIDAIATDHAPHSAEEKSGDMRQALNGIIGLETAFALCYTELVLKEGMPLLRLLELFTSAPAAILGLTGRSLEAGNPAFCTLLDLQAYREIDPEDSFSKSRNMPFAGMAVDSEILLTICRDQISYERETN